jgi:hypothetical protein
MTRRPTRALRRGAPLILTSTAVLALTVGATLGLAAASSTPTPGTASQVAALVAGSVKIKTLSSQLKAELGTAADDNVGTQMGVPTECTSVTQSGCVFGDTSSTKSVVVIGDSHAKMWLPAEIPYLDAQGYKVIYLGEDGCAAVTITLVNTTTPSNCAKIRATVISAIAAMDPAPSVVVISDRTSGNYSAPHKLVTSKAWEAGLETTIKELPKGSRIVIIGDNQIFNTDPIQCLAAYPSSIQSHCSIKNPNPQKPGLEAAEKAAAKKTKSAYIDPTPWLCTSKACSPVIGTYIAYWDQGHVSYTYAEYLSGVMGAALKAAI